MAIASIVVLNAGEPLMDPVKTRITMNKFESRQNAAQTENDWGSHSHVHTLVLMAVTVSAIYFSYRLAAPFLPALAWALALAVLFVPLHRWLESKVKYPGLAAAISVLVAIVIVVAPVMLVMERLISEASRGAETVKTLLDSGAWRRTLASYPLLTPVGDWIEHQLDLPGSINSVASWLANLGTSLVQGSVLQLIGLVLTFYLLFYFLRDRRAVLEWLRFLSPLSRADMNRLFDEVGNTVHATFYGTFVVAIVQGSLGGLMFWWLGLPAPLLWGIVMGLLAVVPVLGAFVIWIPAAIFLLLDGSGGKALLLVLWGAVVVGGIDNLLYPVLVGRRLRMHTVLAFISIVGGLLVFGPSGLILGPLIITVTRLLLEVWRNQDDAQGQDKKPGDLPPVVSSKEFAQHAAPGDQ